MVPVHKNAVETTIMWARSPVCVDFGPLDPPPNEVAPFQRTVNDVRLRHKGDVASETEFGCLHRVDHVNTVLRQDLLLSVSVKSSPPGINGFGQSSCITFLDGVQF